MSCRREVGGQCFRDDVRLSSGFRQSCPLGFVHVLVTRLPELAFRLESDPSHLLVEHTIDEDRLDQDGRGEMGRYYPYSTLPIRIGVVGV